MSEIQALLAELGAKADALAANAEAAPAAEATEAATEEGVAKSEATATEGAAEAGAAEGKAEGAADGEDVAKGETFEVTDAEGNKLQAVDGFALIKALRDEVEALKARVEAEPQAVAKSFTDAAAAADATASALAKSLGVALDKAASAEAALKAADARVAALEAALVEQGDVVKSLQAAVEKIGTQGVGRQSVVTLHERPSTVAKAAPEQTIGDIFAKAIELNRAGKLSSMDVARINASANSGRGLPAEYQPLFAG